MQCIYIATLLTIACYCMRIYSVVMYASFLLSATELLRDIFSWGGGVVGLKSVSFLFQIVMFDITYNKQFWYLTQIK